ncbi:MAG: cytochrome c-type biogenesis protein CcmH [Pseudomonadota bacterium]|nr:cytochrome c-type biogenesis protein CcmH [Pseudomonadota bacterium]
MKTIIVMVLGFWLAFAQAASDVYEFSNPKEREQFTQLTQEIRCLVCQNQSIADSNAPFASDLRTEVYKMVKQQHSDAEIKAFLSKRFGQYVLLNPSISAHTVGLWLAPFGFLLVGFTVLISLITRQRRLAGKQQ